MKLRKELDEISEIVDKIVSSICIVLTAIMFVAVLYQVFGRYVISTSIGWLFLVRACWFGPQKIRQ